MTLTIEELEIEGIGNWSSDVTDPLSEALEAGATEEMIATVRRVVARELDEIAVEQLVTGDLVDILADEVDADGDEVLEALLVEFGEALFDWMDTDEMRSAEEVERLVDEAGEGVKIGHTGQFQ